MKTIRKYHGLFLLFLSVLFAVWLFHVESFNNFLFSLGELGYIGAFIGGALFVISFTSATGAVILITLSEILSPLEIGIIAGLGAMVGDFTIFRFVKDDLVNEIKPLYKRFGGNHVAHLMHSKYFIWTLPVIGAFIIASPLPDEVGVSLMGLSKMKTYQFLLISFLLNAIGIYLIIAASVAIMQ